MNTTKFNIDEVVIINHNVMPNSWNNKSDELCQIINIETSYSPTNYFYEVKLLTGIHENNTLIVSEKWLTL